jgi:ferrous iron transport protein B
VGLDSGGSNQRKKIRLLLVGNPNAGKSSLFNELTGLNQQVGNFPGVTVEKKSGSAKIDKNLVAEVIDLPGTYSLSPRSEDERVTFDYLNEKRKDDLEELIIIIADASNLRRNLLLCSQLIDLDLPVILVLNMMDIVQKNKQTIDIEFLTKTLSIPVVPMNARLGKGVKELKVKVSEFIKEDRPPFISIVEGEKPIDNAQRRNQRIREIVAKALTAEGEMKVNSLTRKLDAILTHKVWGYAIFLLILFLIFQAVFSWSEFPMQMIEEGFLFFGNWVAESLPAGVLNDLLVDGIIAGLGGIIIFIPQIAALFAFISILEDTGYLSRISFMMDGLLKKFGLNGRSIIPLLSGAACAVPAIMSARTISNKKERLLTIFITPLISCSARIPVYTLIIALIIPADASIGIFNLQGIVMMALYLLGFLAAIGTSFFMKFFVKTNESSHFIMEMPIYRAPRWKNVGYTIVNKVKVFLFEAGKIIIAISIILWVLSSYGPGDAFEKIDQKYESGLLEPNINNETMEEQRASAKLQASYAGQLGKFIEPAIRPLGFDWKIGISIITSFAAREVFVGTMATIYSVGDADNTTSLKDKMSQAKDPITGEKVYSKATGYSLLIFYAFALQCMATVAIVARETASWKWPLIQVIYMGALAYFASFITYNLFS